MNVGEAAADVALGAAGGALSVGSWGGGKVRNILSDVGVNTLTGAVQGLTPLIPGGREFSGDEYAKSLAYGAAIGTAFGIAGAKPDPTVSPSVSLGRRFDPNAQPAYQTPTPTAAPSMGAETIRQAEEMAFGESAIRPDMTTAEAVENTAKAKAASDVRTLRRNEDGSVSSLSDQILSDQPIPEGIEPAVAQQAAEIERQVYVDTLMRMHDTETLAKALDLNIIRAATGELKVYGLGGVETTKIAPTTPEEIRAKILNEWVYQAKNGGGIAGIEQRLASLNLDSPLGPVGQAGPTAQAGAPQQSEFVFGEDAGAAYRLQMRDAAQQLLAQNPNLSQQINLPVELGQQRAAITESFLRGQQQAVPPVQPEPVPGQQLGFAQAITDPRFQNFDTRTNINQAARDLVASGAMRPPAGLLTSGPPMQQMDMMNQLSGAMAPEPRGLPLPPAIPGAAIAGPGQTPILPEQIIKGAIDEQARPNPVQASAAGVESTAGSVEIPRNQVRTNAKPNDEVRTAVRTYNAENGFGQSIENHYVPVVETRAQTIADAYDALPQVDDSPEVRRAYSALADEIQAQWDYAINKMGMTFEPWVDEGQPYANSREMVEDVQKNKHLYFFTGGEPHPLLGEPDATGLTINDKLRAIHDLFGHAAEDYQFGPRGEENAWIKHSQMFSPLAQRALTTETRGQNSWVNYGKHNYNPDGTPKNIPAAERPFAQQKVALLPEEFWDWKKPLTESGIELLDDGPATIKDLPAKALADATGSENFQYKTGLEESTTPAAKVLLKEAAGPTDDTIEAVASRFYNEINKLEGRRMMAYGVKNSSIIKTDTPYSEKLSALTRGEEVRFGISSTGEVQRIVKFIGELDGGLDGNEVRRQITKEGRREFADGAVKITEIEPGRYTARLNVDPIKFAEQTLRFAPEAERSDLELKAAQQRIELKQRRSLDDAYADINDVFAEEVSGLGKAKVAVESDDGYSTGAGALEPDEEGNIPTQGKNPLTVAFENWKMNIARTQQEVAKKTIDSFRKMGLPVDSVNPLHVEFWLMSKTGAPAYKEAGQLFVDRYVPESTGQMLDNYFEDALISDAGLQQRYRTYTRINGSVPEKNVAAAVKRRAEKIANLFDTAEQLAAKAGIADPKQIIDYIRYQSIKKNMSMRSQIMSPEDAASVAEKLANVVEDPEAVRMLQDINAVNKNLEGSGAWARILNNNFMNLGPNVKFELRNLPIIRTALTSGLLFGMDGYVDEIQDDETYFGIPGSVLRKALGDGNAGTYALMGSMPYIRGGLKSVIKPGTRTGIRRMATAFKQAAQDRAEAVSESFARRSYGALPDADLRAAAEREAAMPGAAIDPDTGIKYEPGSSGYNAWIVNFMKMHRETHNPNFKAGDSKGTIGMIEQWTTDLNLLRAKIPFIKNMIGEPLDRMQVEQRKTAAEMKKFFDNEYAPVMRKYRDLNDDRIPKAMAAFDYRMTDLANAKGKISDEAYYSAKQAEEERIKNDYFMVDTPEGRQLDANAYADYVKVQQTFDALRTRHIASLIGFQEGVPYYEIAAQKQRLKADRGVTQQMFGAAEKQLKKLENDLTQFNDEMAQARASGAAKEDLVGYEARRRTLQQDVAEQRKITSDIEEQLTTLDNSITRLESVDDMAVRSQETGYILRHRDNVSQYVLRLSYDGDFKMPGVRREYASRFTANTALVDQARAFASDFQAKRVIDLTSKLADVEAKLEVDPENVKLLEKQQRLNKALAQENAEGRKAFSDMTDIEVLNYLRSQNVRADVYRRGSNRAKVSAAAKRAIMDALNAADKLEGVLVGRSNEDFTRAVKYVNEANRAGNQTLVEAGADGGVVTYDVQTKAGQQSFIDEMIDQINDMVDGTVDTDQLRDILERKLTYRETKTETTKLGKRTVEQIHIDMPALRAIVSRFLEPSIPNLSKRNNVAGYYDPDGNWTAKQHWDYITGSAEMMQGQIASYTVRSASRSILSNAIDTLRRYRVDNGLIEFISSYTTQDSMLSDIEDAVVRKAYAARRAYGITTLATNLSNAVMNRVFGSILSVSHQGMHAMTKYGVYQQLPDGKLSEVQWMDSQAEARAFMADKADKGEVGWQEARGTTFKNVGFRELGVAAGSLIAPKTTLRMLASRDPYWKAVYEESLRLNLQEGSAIGNYAMREEIEKGTGREKLVNLMTYMTRKIENANNWTSILNSAATAKMRMGITTQDFATLGTKQVSEAMQKVLRPSLDRMALHNKAGVELQAEIANLQERLKDPNIPAAQKQHLESLIKQKQRYMSDQDLTPERAFMDSLMEYIVFDRQFEQGGWTKMDQSRIERTLNKNPAGVIAMTFAAPMFRSTSAYLAMLREMKNTHGTVPQKLARYAPVIIGGAALTLLGGIRANTTAIAPIAFMGDVAGLSEFLYDIFTTDDENKVTQASKRGMWESAGEYMAEQMGYDPQYGRDFVRAFFSEGLIRYVSDAAVSAESGVFDGLMMPGGQGMLTTGKNFFKTMMAYGDTDDFVGRLYNTTNMLPTSLKRGTQAVIQGAMGTKLDRLGNPVKEEFGSPEDIGAYKKFSIGDALRHAVAGKRWSEIRSTLYDMDGSFDVSTPEGAVRFANYLEGASGLKFGEGIRSRKPGPREAFQMAQIERDAYFVQRRLRQNYDNKYADVIRSAKDELNSEIASGVTIRIDGQNITLERALTLVGTGGNKTEQDLARKGGSTLSARQQMMKDIEHWGFIANTKQTIEETYGKNSVQVTDQLYGGAEDDPIQYAKWKFMTRLQDAAASEKLRRQGRIYYNGYNTP
jgi:hypothetical protein